MSGDGQAHRHRRIAGASSQPKEARACLREEVLTRQSCPGPLLAVARDRAVDDAGVERADVVEAEALPLDHARAEVLHHHVGLRHEVAQERAVPLVAEVRGEALLVAVDGVEEAVGAADLCVRQVERAAEVALARPLDLDNAGAEIGELERGKRARKELAEVHHEEPVERETHARLSQ
jgi:hypothetical protein